MWRVVNLFLLTIVLAVTSVCQVARLLYSLDVEFDNIDLESIRKLLNNCNCCLFMQLLVVASMSTS